MWTWIINILGCSALLICVLQTQRVYAPSYGSRKAWLIASTLMAGFLCIAFVAYLSVFYWKSRPAASLVMVAIQLMGIVTWSTILYNTMSGLFSRIVSLPPR